MPTINNAARTQRADYGRDAPGRTRHRTRPAYARELRRAGFTVERLGFTPWIFPPTRELLARKSG